MRWTHRWGWAAGAVWTLAALGGELALSGCGMPGAPQPPSLNLPGRVTDLSAARAGNQVSLNWTMPKKNTDKLLLKGNIEARVCRRESSAGPCVAAGTVQFAPGADAVFADTLPAALAAGEPRALTYFVALENRRNRSAGESNPAEVLAGQAPDAVDGLSATMARNGVMLRWTAGVPGSASPETAATVIRLQRKLLTPPAASGAKPQQKPEGNLLAPPPEPAERTLLVRDTTQGRAIDKDIRLGESYAYRVQRVAQVSAAGKMLELDGPLSAPVRIDAAQVLPPVVPSGLAAVAVAAENGAAAVTGAVTGAVAGAVAGAGIDLSWTPDTEADLAGYIVYRREGEGPWQRISPAQPLVGPGFHDSNVQAGHTYHYAVSAVDTEGNESARSAEAQETVPEP